MPLKAAKFSVERLTDYFQKRFDGNQEKLMSMLMVIEPNGSWNYHRVRRLLRGETAMEPNDLAVFKVALNLDHIDDLYEEPLEGVN